MAAVHSENDHYKFYEQRGYRLTDEVYEGGRHGCWSRTYLVTYEGPPRCWASEPTARRQSDKSPRRGRHTR